MSAPSSQPPTAPEALERLGRLPLRKTSMADLLQTVADLSRTVMPGRPEASVSLLVRGRPSTAVTTSGFAVQMDESQYELGYGPCLHAARTGELTEIPDTRTDDRWPDYARSAAENGNLSSLSVPLVVDVEQDVRGALNIYAREAHAFDETSRAAGLAFGAYASVAVGNLHAYAGARSEADNLHVALASRAVIDQAKGILMERHKLTADEAFQLLARASMESNRKLRDVADQLVHTGELPVDPALDGGRRASRAQPGRPDLRGGGSS